VAISALLNAGFLQPLSSANAVLPLSKAQQLGTASAKPNSSRLLPDTYTPSTSSRSASSSSSASAALLYGQMAQATEALGVSYTASVTSSPVTGVPQSVYAVLQNENDPVQQAWSTLAQNLVSGDLTAAQSSLNAYSQNLANSNYGMSSLTAPTAQFTSDLAALGSAIQSGDAKAAQAAFETASTQAPKDVMMAMAMAVGQVQRDEMQSMQGVEHSGGLSATDITQLASDMASLNSVNQEAAANISDYLISMGYSASDANTYAKAITDASTTIGSSISDSVTGVSNGSISSASTQVSISVSEDARGDLSLTSILNTSASAGSSADAMSALESAQTAASTNIADWVDAHGYTSLDVNAYSRDQSSASTDASGTANTKPTVDTSGSALWIKELALLSAASSTSQETAASPSSSYTIAASAMSATSIALWNQSQILLESTWATSSASLSVYA